MNASTKVTLKIITFKNPSGAIVFRVTGMFYGERLQKNFRTREEARTFMDGLIKAGGQGESCPTRSVNTIFLRDEDLDDAQLAWRRLRAKHPSGSLVTAVDYYLLHAGHVIKDCLAQKALEDFDERRRKRGNDEGTIKNTHSVLNKFLREMKVTNISDFTPEAAEKFIFDSTVVMRTRRDRYDHLFNFSEDLRKQRHLVHNFIHDIGRPRVTNDGVVTTLTVEQVLTLLRTAARASVGRKKRERIGAMLAYFAVCTLSGLRPDEAKRLGPDWKWYSRENRLVTGFVAKRKNAPRTVALDDNLVAILEHCRERGYAPSHFTKKAFESIRAQAKVFDSWDNDILRHTYASHHYAWKKDMNYLEKNMGNSEVVLKASYLDRTIPEKVGAQLFSITLENILAA